MTSILTRPSMHHAMLLAFTGQLDEAREAMRSISADCDVRGQESEQIIVAVHRMLVENWRELHRGRGDRRGCTGTGPPSGRRLPLAGALTTRAAVAADVGRPDEARHDAEEAQPGVQASGAVFMTAATSSWRVLGGVPGQPRGGAVRAGSAVVDLRPRLTEIYFAAFIPDAVEAMVRWISPRRRAVGGCVGTQWESARPGLDAGTRRPLPSDVAGRARRRRRGVSGGRGGDGSPRSIADAVRTGAHPVAVGPVAPSTTPKGRRHGHSA